MESCICGDEHTEASKLPRQKPEKIMSAILTVRHTVADYDTWKVAYDKADSLRAEHGCTGEQVYRTPADPNDVFATHDFPNVEKAQAFAADPALAAAMTAAGVSSPPRIEIFERA
jgi:quinol monooxygenase YgiN